MRSRMMRRLIWTDLGTMYYGLLVGAVAVGAGIALLVDPLAGGIVGPVLGGAVLAFRDWAVFRHNRQVLGDEEYERRYH